MRFKPNPRQTTRAIYAFLVLAATILFTLLLGSIGTLFGWVGSVLTILKPVVYGFVIAYLLNSPLRTIDDRFLVWLSRDKLKPSIRRGIAILITYLLALVVLSAFTAIVLPQVVNSCVSIANNIPSYYKSIQTLFFNVVNSLSDNELLQNEDIVIFVNEMANRLYASIMELFENLGVWLAGFGGKLILFAGNLTNAILDIVLGIIISIYLLADREKLFAQIHKISRSVFSEERCTFLYGLIMDTHRVFNGFIVGKIIDSAIIGVLCFIGMSIFRMPYTVLISVIIGVTNVIPYFGPFIGAVPGFILIFITDPGMSFWFLVFILILQQLDGNVIGPKILGDSTGLAPIWIVVSIMLFSGLMGPIGMFIGVPLFAVIYQLVKRFVAFLLRQKDLSSNTRDYDTDRNRLIK